METDGDWTRMLRTKFSQALATFASSPDTFRLLHSINSSKTAPIKTVYVLDSSFNPPTQAHLSIASQALLNDDGARPARLLFLLAIENADKKPKPAVFEDRLVMMALMASNIKSTDVDIGVTKKPLFIDKAASIDDSGVYESAQQVHLTGYDTIIRIFNPKYYPADRKLGVLEPFLSKHRLRVCFREDGNTAPTREEQQAYVDRIGDGSRESDGMNRKWSERVQLVDDAKEVMGVSSTEARKAAVVGNKEELEKLVGRAVGQYVLNEELYTE